MKARESLQRLLKTDKSEHTLAGAVLLATFVVLLVWYFLASYIGHRDSLRIQEKMLTPHDDLFAVDAAADGNAIAVGKFGLILQSSDGGKSWQSRASGTTQPLSAVSFADRTHGFVLGAGGTLLATEDGGATWKAQDSGTRDQLLAVYAVTPMRAFAVGAFGTLLSTADGGRHWTRHDMRWEVLIERIVRDAGLVEPNLNAVYFNSPEIGWIAGEFGLVLHTTDGGQTWTSQRYGSDMPQLYAIKFVDNRHGWAVGQAGSLLQTTNGGHLWSPVEFAVKRDLYQISLEGERGVIVGDRIVFASHNGGRHWQPLDFHGANRWLSGAVLKGSNALVVGGAGTTRLLGLDNINSNGGNKIR